MTRPLVAVIATTGMIGAATVGPAAPTAANIDGPAAQVQTTDPPPTPPPPPTGDGGSSGGFRAEVLDERSVEGVAVDVVPTESSGDEGSGGAGSGGSGDGLECWYEAPTWDEPSGARAVDAAYASTEGTPGRWGYSVCEDNSRSELQFFPDGEPATPAAAQPTIATLQTLAESVVITPTVPALHTSPRMDWMTFVNFDTWFWVEPDQLVPLQGQANAGNVTVTVTATPRDLVIDPGDRTGFLRCPDGGTPYDTSRPEATQSSNCTHRYQESSWRSHDERTHGTATVVYDITWTSSLGPGGNLGTITPDPAPFAIRVAEIQSVNIPTPTR